VGVVHAGGRGGHIPIDIELQSSRAICPQIVSDEYLQKPAVQAALCALQQKAEFISVGAYSAVGSV